MKILSFFNYVSESANDKQLHISTIFCIKCFIWYLRVKFFKKIGPCKPFYQLFRVFSSKLRPKKCEFSKFQRSPSQIKNTKVKDSISIGSRKFKKGFIHKSAFPWLNSTLVSTQFEKDWILSLFLRKIFIARMHVKQMWQA